MRVMQGDKNISLIVTVIMTFNNMLTCNHEIIINLLQCIFSRTDIYTCMYISRFILDTLTYGVRSLLEILEGKHN